jgi:hypothetical protein
VTEIYDDPYDFEIDADPHPIWRRSFEDPPLHDAQRALPARI